MSENKLAKIGLLVDQAKYDAAIKLCFDVLAEQPENEFVFGHLGESFLGKDNYTKAHEFAQKAIGLDPEEDTYHFLEARIYLQESELKKALKSVNEAIRINPYISNYFGGKGIILFNLDDFNAAIKAAKTGLNLYAEDTTCKTALSLSLNALGKADEAISISNRALEENPEDSISHATLGHSLLANGEVNKAKTHFTEALMLEPTSEYAREGLLEATRSTNWFYRKYMQFSSWSERGNRWWFYIGIYVVARLVPFLLPFYLIFIFWGWFAQPIANLILLFDKKAKYLFSDKTLRLTHINAILVISSIVLGIASFTISFKLLGLAVLCFYLIVPINLLAIYTAKKNVTALYGYIGFLVLATVTGTVLLLLGNEPALAITPVVLLTIVIFTWVFPFTEE